LKIFLFSLGNHCEYSPFECQRNLVSNDTEKLKEINQLSINICKTERENILDKYFTCIHERSFEYCHCPSSKITKILSIQNKEFLFFN